VHAEARIPPTAWWVAGLAAIGLHVLLLQAWVPASRSSHGEAADGTTALSRLRFELGAVAAAPAVLPETPATSPPPPAVVAKQVPAEAPRRETRLSALPSVAAAPPAAKNREPAEAGESLASSGVQASRPAGGQEVTSLDPGSGAEPNPYFEALYARVLRARDYPRRARLDGVEGTVVLGIEIDRQGRIQSSRVRESSGSRSLDRHAARIAKRAAPFGPVPPHFQEADLTFELPVQFTLTD